MELLKTLKIAGVVSGLVLTACSPQSQNSNKVSSDSSQTGIIGGTVVEASDVISKSTVFLQSYTKSADGKTSVANCTGTLVREDIVLTAGHCVPALKKGEQAVMVAAFVQDYKTKPDQKLVRYVSNVVVHPNYVGDDEESSEAKVSETLAAAAAAPLAPVAPAAAAKEQAPEEEEKFVNYNDFALIKLAAPAPEGFVPAKILTDEALLSEGAEVIVAGFGINDDIKKTSDGKLKKAKTLVLGSYGNELLTDQSRGESICSGDSGGPAFLEVKGQLYVWGVASRVGNPRNEAAYCSGGAIHGKISSETEFLQKGMAFLDKVSKK